MIKNYCLVGTGDRGVGMYAIPLVQDYQNTARLTGLCDLNAGRVSRAVDIVGGHVHGFTDLDEMLDTVPCDVVIVTTNDATHDEFIIKAMRRGKDVITEKPMTVNAEKCREILRTEQETGRNVRVTFNARYTPYRTRIKQLLQEGIVGDIHSVELRWFLDTVHGADYFRRWHRNKEVSGGLLVHKATHHFDLINWWLNMEPVEVAAMGSKHFYVPSQKANHGERCLTCSEKNDCAFHLDLTQGHLRSLYLENEQYDAYYRDRCVFSDEINIEDTLSAIVRYPQGVQLTYALTAATPFEGWQVAFNGSKGRLEAFEPDAFIAEEDQLTLLERSKARSRIDWRLASNESNLPSDSIQIRFYPLFGGVKTHSVAIDEGDHGGGDRRLRDHLFRGVTADPFGHTAGSRAGAMSILIGIAANQSIAQRRFITIDSLLNG